MFFSVKWWVLLVGIGVHFITGMLWYGPFFGKPWMKLVGITEQEIRDSGGMTPLFFVSSILTAVVSTYTLVIVFNLVYVQSIAGAIGLATLLWLGFSAAPNLNNGLFEKRPFRLFLINSFFRLTTLLVLAIVIQIAR